jgi:hypothetical protein
VAAIPGIAEDINICLSACETDQFNFRRSRLLSGCQSVKTENTFFFMPPSESVSVCPYVYVCIMFDSYSRLVIDCFIDLCFEDLVLTYKLDNILPS